MNGPYDKLNFTRIGPHLVIKNGLAFQGVESDLNPTVLNLQGYNGPVGMNYETHNISKETLFQGLSNGLDFTSFESCLVSQIQHAIQGANLDPNLDIASVMAIKIRPCPSAHCMFLSSQSPQNSLRILMAIP